MNRREFLFGASKTLLWLGSTAVGSATRQAYDESKPITLFLGGDVMTGRGIDQVLPHPGDPRIYEPHMKSALGYVELAEEKTGPLPRPVGFSYIWGDALEELERVSPEVRIINLETAVTKSDDRVPKGIHYRMHPKNIPCLTVAKIDCCVVGNNHILDWGYPGLAETLHTLRQASMQTAGAGQNFQEAAAPVILQLSDHRRVVVFSFGSTTSGIPREWGATTARAGVNLLEDFSSRTVERIGRRVAAVKHAGDIVLASIHWGANWGYPIPREESVFAHALVDEAAVDVVHGHSSHHPKGIEVYKGKPILYGCGDLINDYEGILGYEEYRGDLVLLYFLCVEPSTRILERLEMTPFQVKRFRLNRVSREDALWLQGTLNREGAKFGTSVELGPAHRLRLRWN
jgi:poly-gamma-glutamate synthesis protein (capsule biosynthesis protein)